MLSKIIELEDRFPTGEPTLMVVQQRGHAGWLHEKRALASSASPALEYIQNVSPEEGTSIILVNALGAFETYDDNRNGDGFPELPYNVGKPALCGHKECQTSNGWINPEEVLTRHYGTFEQFGGIYEHHCFPAGTEVLMADRTRVPIELIARGDQVVTLDGMRPVTRVMRRAYQGSGVRLELRGELDDLTATADHPILAYRRSQIHCRHGYSRLTPKSHAKNCVEYRNAVSEPTWLPAKELAPGDYLVLPRPKHGEEEVESHFAELIGWVASEGYVSDAGTIAFTFSAKNKVDVSRVKACLEANGLSVGVYPRPQYGTIYLCASSVELSRQIRKYVSGTLSDKHLKTAAVLNWNREALLRLLGAYIDGDGHVSRNRKNRGQLRIRSSSRAMLRGLADVCRAVGVDVTLNWDFEGGVMVSPTNGETYPASGSGCVAATPDNATALCVYSRKKPVRGQEASRSCPISSTYLVQVSGVESIRLNEFVYNLEVEGPHHFVANEVVVHNCNKDPSKSLGKILKAFWNARMHRVELLLKIVNERKPDLIQRINDGDYPACSMGCHVRWDVCSVCGHRAPTRKEYCNHLKFEMRKIDPQTGVRYCALNPSCRFFDISIVIRPADTTGFMMKKVAEATRKWWPGADLGAKVAEFNFKQARVRKLSEMQKDLVGDVLGARLSEEGVIIKNYRRFMLDGSVPTKPPASDEQLDKMARFTMPEVLSTLATKNAALSASEFTQLLMRKCGFDASDLMLDKVAALQPFVNEIFAQYPDLYEKAAASVAMSEKLARPALASALGPWLQKRASIGEWLRQQGHEAGGPLGLGAPLGPGAAYEAHAPAKTDMLTMTDPNTGEIYRTNRAALQKADDTNYRSLIGGTALMSGAYALALGQLPLANKLPLAARTLAGIGLGAGTMYAARDYLDPHEGDYETDQGIRAPGNTEFRKSGSLATPALLDKLAHDYTSRLASARPGADLSELLTNKLAQSCACGERDPLVKMLRDKRSVSSKVAALFSRYEEPSYDSTVPPGLDFDRAAEVLGSLVATR